MGALNGLGGVRAAQTVPQVVKDAASEIAKRYEGVKIHTKRGIMQSQNTNDPNLYLFDDLDGQPHTFQILPYGPIDAVVLEMPDSADKVKGPYANREFVLSVYVKRLDESAKVRRFYWLANLYYDPSDNSVETFVELDEDELLDPTNDSKVFLPKEALIARGELYAREKLGTGLIMLYAGQAAFVDHRGRNVLSHPFLLERGGILVNCKDIRVDYDDGSATNDGKRRAANYRSPKARVVIHVPRAVPVKPEDVPPIVPAEVIASYEKSYGPLRISEFGFPVATIDARGVVTKEEWQPGHPVWGGHRGLNGLMGWRR